MGSCRAPQLLGRTRRPWLHAPHAANANHASWLLEPPAGARGLSSAQRPYRRRLFLLSGVVFAALGNRLPAAVRSLQATASREHALRRLWETGTGITRFRLRSRPPACRVNRAN